MDAKILAVVIRYNKEKGGNMSKCECKNCQCENCKCEDCTCGCCKE